MGSPRASSAPGKPADKGALAPSGGEGQPAGLQLERLDGPIEQLLVDAEDAMSTWRILKPLAEDTIRVLRGELEKAAAEGEVDLNAAQKLLTTLSTAAKSYASAAGIIAGTFERLVELKQTLGGGGRDLSKLPESVLRKIVLAAAGALDTRTRTPALEAEVTIIEESPTC